MRDVTKLNIKQLNVCCNVPTLITLLRKGLGRHTAGFDYGKYRLLCCEC